MPSSASNKNGGRAAPTSDQTKAALILLDRRPQCRREKSPAEPGIAISLPQRSHIALPDQIEIAQSGRGIETVRVASSRSVAVRRFSMSEQARLPEIASTASTPQRRLFAKRDAIQKTLRLIHFDSPRRKLLMLYNTSSISARTCTPGFCPPIELQPASSESRNSTFLSWVETV